MATRARSREREKAKEREKALATWHGALSGSVRQGPVMSARQMALLLSVYVTPPPHTVRGLARALNISKPAVTRAIDALTARDYVRRARDAEDGRNVLIRRTAKGETFLGEFADFFEIFLILMKTLTEGKR